MKGKSIMGAVRGLQATIVTFISCAILVFALDDTLRGVVIIDAMTVAAYIAATILVWTAFSPSESKQLLALAMAVSTLTGIRITILILEVRIIASRWSDLSEILDQDRFTTLWTTALGCVPVLFIVLLAVIVPRSPTCDDED